MELGDGRVAAGVRVVHEEAAVLRVAWMEGEPQQPALAAAADARRDVEERRRPRAAVADDPNAAPLFHHEDAAIVGRRLQIEGLDTTLRDALRTQRRRSRHERRA